MKAFEELLRKIAEDLDLNQTEEDAITRSYEAVGNYLKNSKELSSCTVNIFPQGSVRLGTVVKPLTKDDYDVDLVCEICIKQATVSPMAIKKIVGNVLKCSKRYGPLLEEEHGRCWTLAYPANPPYHLDILTGVSYENGKVAAGIKNESTNSYEWLITNPKGFANWFLGLKKRTLLEDEKSSVEKVKTFDRRTILQRAVQLIKRHRDVFFKDEPKKGPASVIITALTGLSYNGETTIYDILKNGPIQWMSHISYKDGKYSIKVPSLKDDDYADKWNGEDPDAPSRFFLWHRKLLLDLDNLFSARYYNRFVDLAKGMFFESSVDRVLNDNSSVKKSLMESYLGNKNDARHDLFPWAQINAPSVKAVVIRKQINCVIECREYQTREEAELFGGNYLRSFKLCSPMLEKGTNLGFKAYVNGNTTGVHYRILWQITNTGEEAKSNHQLRGSFEEPKNNKIGFCRDEHVSYTGTHFVQAFVVDKANDCLIAKSQIITINVGL